MESHYSQSLYRSPHKPTTVKSQARAYHKHIKSRAVTVTAMRMQSSFTIEGGVGIRYAAGYIRTMNHSLPSRGTNVDYRGAWPSAYCAQDTRILYQLISGEHPNILGIPTSAKFERFRNADAPSLMQSFRTLGQDTTMSLTLEL